MGISLKESFQLAEILNHANPSSLAEIAAFAYLKKVPKGSQLFQDREEISSLYILVSGRASLYKVNSLGEKKVIFVYGPGKMLNEDILQSLAVAISCEMLEDSCVLALPMKQFRLVMWKDSGLANAVVESMALKIRRMYRQLKNTTNSLIGEKRLAAKIYKLSKDYGVAEEHGIRIDMNLTITYLAEMLGSKRETVSRQAKKLRELELIEVHKNYIIVLDQKKLSNYFKSP